MRFLANENFPGAAVTALQAAGHDVIWVRIVAPGMTDPDVLAWAVREERILLTFDKDFGELALEGEPPLLSIGDYWQARTLLEPDRVLHGPVFAGFEVGMRHPARRSILPRRNEFRWAEKTADVVCMASDHGGSSATRPRGGDAHGQCRALRAG